MPKPHRCHPYLKLVCRLTLALTLTAALLLPLAGCDNRSPEATAAPPPGVLVAKARFQAISDTVELIGQTVAVNDVSLRAQVEGYLLERNFEEGQDVEVGALLFVIDPALYAASVAAAKGAVAQASAELARANKDLKRYRTLIKKQSVSQQKVDAAESDKLQAQANLESARAQLLKAEIDLEHTRIKAPIKGRIGRARASAGDLVTPQSEELARLVELDPIYVNFSVSEGDLIETRRRLLAGGGQGDEALSEVAVKLRLPDGSLFEHTGRLDFIDNVVDRRTGTVIVRARFDNPERLLVPGMYVRTVLSREETQDRLLIPQAAIQEDQAGKFVMVVGPDDKVEQRRIETGAAHAGALVVLEGLEPDEEVIVEGIQKVRPGLLVAPKAAPDPNAGNPQTEAAQPERDAAPAQPSAGTAAED